MIKKYSGIEFAAKALELMRARGCYIYDTHFLRYLGEMLMEKKIKVSLFDSMERIKAIMGMRGNTKLSTCFFISQKYLSVVEEAKKSNNQKGVVFVLVCDDSDLSTIRIARAMKMPVWIAGRASDIYTMMVDADAYSVEKNMTTIVCVSAGYFFVEEEYDCSQIQLSFDDAMKRAERKYGSGSECIITAGNVAPVVRNLYGHATDTMVCEAGALNLNDIGRNTGAKNKIYIMPKLGTITPDEQEVEEIFDKKVCYEERYRSMLLMEKPGKKKEKNKQNKLNKANEMVMCPGCGYRRIICEYLDRYGDGKVAYAEEIYCRKKLSMVTAGMERRFVRRCSSVAELEKLYEGGRYKACIAFVNGPVKAGKGIDLVDTGTKVLCPDGTGETMGIDLSKFQSCGECREKTGCPALNGRAFAFNPDTGLCANCGLCIRYCSKGVLY